MSDAHRIALRDGWSVWRTVALRGAGFPVSRLLELAAPDVAQAADRVIAAAEAVATARQRVRAACHAAREAAPPEVRKHYRLLLAQIDKRVPPPFDGAPAEVVAALSAFGAAEQALAHERAALERSHEQDSARASETLRAIARDPRFREAVVWQNRSALHGALDALLRQPTGVANFKTRKYERLIANYLQRYCAKNDTVGFFGPVGWASFGERTHVAPGGSLLAARTTYLDYWGVDRVAQVIAADPAVQPDLVPRRMPTVWISGTTLHHPPDRTAEVGPVFARLLDACDGERTARAIAELLCPDPALELEGPDEVYALLAQLVERKLATWTIELPVVGDPVEHLRRALERLGDPHARQRALATVAELEMARDAIAAAAGDPAALERALADLEATFTRITSAAATRNAGNTYGARTLAYEDCRRDVAVELGPALRDALAAPLVLLLDSARWYSHEIAVRYRRRMREVHDALRGQGAGATIDYLRFWHAIEHELSGELREPPAIVAEVLDELHRKWLALLGAPFTERRVSRTADELRAAVREAFAVPHYGWPSARQHSPDVMIAADRLDADPLFVLGELHATFNSLFNPVFLKQHPRPDELVAWMADEIPRCVAPAGMRELVTRAHELSLAADDLDLEVGTTRSWRPRERVIALGELVIEDIAGELVIRTRDRRYQFSTMVFLNTVLRAQSLAHFRIMPGLRHTPRITIDRLVLSREQWTFGVPELVFVQPSLALASRFAEVRRWARSHGIPRFVFFRIREEPKPCYLDLESPTYVENFARLLRKSAVVQISEMLPTPAQCWLPDARGQRYCSELRMVAVDPEPWREATDAAVRR